MTVERSGRYKIVVIYQDPWNGLKSRHERESELPAGEHTVEVMIPASSARKDLGVWYAKLPLGSAEIIVYKWTTEKELIGFELAESEESKQPDFWEVSRSGFSLD